MQITWRLESWSFQNVAEKALLLVFWNFYPLLCLLQLIDEKEVEGIHNTVDEGNHLNPHLAPGALTVSWGVYLLVTSHCKLQPWHCLYWPSWFFLRINFSSCHPLEFSSLPRSLEVKALSGRWKHLVCNAHAYKYKSMNTEALWHTQPDLSPTPSAEVPLEHPGEHLCVSLTSKRKNKCLGKNFNEYNIPLVDLHHQQHVIVKELVAI